MSDNSPSHSIESRKSEHLQICLHEDVNHGNTRLDEIHLVAKALPELALEEISIETTFLGRKVSAPFFISCMTGGSKEGTSINHALAESAAELGIPLGLGSIRILLENESRIKDFSLRHCAPYIPIFANLGANQLAHVDEIQLFRLLETLGVDALALHLNPAQELYQKNGDKDFRGFISNIDRFISHCPFPVIIKETGYGISTKEAHLLLGYGARYIDIAGGGGTNWAKVEQLRAHKDSSRALSQDRNTMKQQQSVYELSTPTGILMLSLCDAPRVLASGGIRNALDIAKCLALGAEHVGMALPVLNALFTEKKDTSSQRNISSASLISYLDTIANELKHIMLLCGAKNIGELHNTAFWIESTLQKDFSSYAKALNLAIPSRIYTLLS